MKKNSNNLRTLAEEVKTILENDIEARKSDTVLIVDILKKKGIDTNAPFIYIIQNAPFSLESITRARRKVQQEYPELRDDYVGQLRMNLKAKYIELAQDRRV